MENQIQELQDELASLDLSKPKDKARSEELNKAIAQFQSSTTVENPPVVATTKALPKQSQLERVEGFAMFLEATTRGTAPRQVVVVSLLDPEGVEIELTTSPNFWKRFATFITPESPYCKYKGHIQKEGQAFLGNDGSTITPSQDSISMAGLVRVPEKVWEKIILGNEKTSAQREEILQRDIQTISALDKETTDTAAIAQLMRAARYGV